MCNNAGNIVCRESNDFLLPAMITFLNDRDWQLRAAFFHHICEMGSYAGSEGLQAFLLPCLEQVCCFLTQVCSAYGTTFSTIAKCVPACCACYFVRLHVTSCASGCTSSQRCNCHLHTVMLCQSQQAPEAWRAYLTCQPPPRAWSGTQHV